MVFYSGILNVLNFRKVSRAAAWRDITLPKQFHSLFGSFDNDGLSYRRD